MSRSKPTTEMQPTTVARPSDKIRPLWHALPVDKRNRSNLFSPQPATGMMGIGRHRGHLLESLHLWREISIESRLNPTMSRISKDSSKNSCI
jgi:hypothetical protein